MFNKFHLVVVIILTLQLQNTYKFHRIPLLHEYKPVKKFCQFRYLIKLIMVWARVLKRIVFINELTINDASINKPTVLGSSIQSKIYTMSIIGLISLFSIVLYSRLNECSIKSSSIIKQLNTVHFYRSCRDSIKNVKQDTDVEKLLFYIPRLKQNMLLYTSKLEQKSILCCSYNKSNEGSDKENSQISTITKTSTKPISVKFKTSDGSTYKEFKLFHLFAKLNSRARYILDVYTPTVLGGYQYFSTTQQLKSLRGPSYSDKNIVEQLLYDLEDTEEYSLLVKLQRNMILNYVESFQDILVKYLHSSESINGLIISLANLGLLNLVTNQGTFNPLVTIPMQGSTTIENQTVEVLSTPVAIVASQFDLTYPLSEESVNLFKASLVEFIDSDYKHKIDKIRDRFLDNITKTQENLARVLVPYYTRGIEYYTLYSALSLDMLYLILNPQYIRQGTDNPVQQLIRRQFSNMMFINHDITEVKSDSNIITPSYMQQNYVLVYNHKLTNEDLHDPGNFNLGLMLNYLTKKLNRIFESLFLNKYSKFIKLISKPIESLNKVKVLQQFIHNRIKQYWKKPSYL